MLWIRQPHFAMPGNKIHHHYTQLKYEAMQYICFLHPLKSLLGKYFKGFIFSISITVFKKFLFNEW